MGNGRARRGIVSIQDLANQCVRDVHGALGIELDFAPETLPVLDHYCRTLAGQRHRPEVLELLARSIGAYFGEVVRRRFGCRWHVGPGGPKRWRLEFEGCFLFFNPAGVALELLAQSDAEGWGANFVTWPDALEALIKQLDQLPSVTHGEYYALSTRYEVLMLVTDFLMARRGQYAGPYDVQFYEKQVALRDPAVAADVAEAEPVDFPDDLN